MLLIFRYKYFLVISIMVELIIINISMLVYLISGGYIELGPIFVHYLVFSMRDRVIWLF